MGKRVVAINGSPRKDGNTHRALEIVGEELTACGMEVELIQLGGIVVRGCQACRACAKRNGLCALDDGMNEILRRVWAADGLLIGSPTYFSNVSTETKAFIDRCGCVSGANGGLLRGKIGAAVTAARRAGSNMTFAAINYLFTKCEMPVATSGYWNMTLAREPGDIDADSEGVETFRTLGRNMAFLLERLR